MKNEINETVIIQAPTGSGKTYQAILKSFFYCILQNKIVILATPTLMLVDQIHDDVIFHYIIVNFYEGKNPIPGLPVERLEQFKRVQILKYTSREKIDNVHLFEMFSEGGCIIITVHNYLQEADHFKNTSFFF